METFISNQSWPILALVFLMSLIILSKATDTLIDHAVSLSREFGISELIIGATIVSVGTTLPELSTAIAAIMQDATDFVLGNAIGSVITNMTLVLGIGSIAGAIPVMRTTASRLPFLIGSLLLMVFGSVRTFGAEIFSSTGRIHPVVGILLLLSLPVYLLTAFREPSKEIHPEADEEPHKKGNLIKETGIIFLSAVAVALSASALVTTVEAAAVRLGVSDAIIAGTIVALGTSLPELTTTYASARKGFGGLAIGNILGASILNILLVLGVSISLVPGGLGVAPIFYQIHFPIVLLVVGMVSYFIFNTKKLEISKMEGAILLAIYVVYLLLNIFL